MTGQAKKKNIRHREDFPLCVFFAKKLRSVHKKTSFYPSDFLRAKMHNQKKFRPYKG